MNRQRADIVAELEARERTLDIVVIGGGANGAGIALDAASRGLNVALFERGDFGSGTSSRSSKLIHGGVRYLGLGQWNLVREALAERSTLLANAPAIVKAQRFLIPAYSYLELAKFRIGLKFYDWLAGGHGLRSSEWIDSATAGTLTPGLCGRGLRGVIAYDDAVFDDCRLLVSVLARAREYGALVLNYAEVKRVLRNAPGRACGVLVHDHASGRELEVRATVVINAAGPYGDNVRTLDHSAAATTLSPSQGAHIVVPASFLPGGHALVLPRTRDGRIMFALPWHGHVVLGTTDTPMGQIPRQPQPFAAEIDAILEVANEFILPGPSRADIVSSFAGLRPLVGIADGSATSRRSREHALDVSGSGMISVSGGKWTTYRLIAEQAVDLAARVGQLAAPPSSTTQISLAAEATSGDPRFEAWADAAQALAQLVHDDPRLGENLHPDLPYCGAHFVWAARAEFALSVADALAYRTRAMFLNAGAAADIAPTVAAFMAAELGHDEAWIKSEIDAATRIAAGFALTGRQ